MGSKASIETRNARESTSKHGDDGYLVAKQRENEVAEVTEEKIEYLRKKEEEKRPTRRECSA